MTVGRLAGWQVAGGGKFVWREFKFLKQKFSSILKLVAFFSTLIDYFMWSKTADVSAFLGFSVEGGSSLCKLQLDSRVPIEGISEHSCHSARF